MHAVIILKTFQKLVRKKQYPIRMDTQQQQPWVYIINAFLKCKILFLVTIGYNLANTWYFIKWRTSSVPKSVFLYINSTKWLLLDSCTHTFSYLWPPNLKSACHLGFFFSPLDSQLLIVLSHCGILYFVSLGP